MLLLLWLLLLLSYIFGATHVRNMGGAPRNLAPRSHFLVWIVKPSSCHCTDGHVNNRVFTED